MSVRWERSITIGDQLIVSLLNQTVSWLMLIPRWKKSGASQRQDRCEIRNTHFGLICSQDPLWSADIMLLAEKLLKPLLLSLFVGCRCPAAAWCQRRCAAQWRRRCATRWPGWWCKSKPCKSVRRGMWRLAPANLWRPARICRRKFAKMFQGKCAHCFLINIYSNKKYLFQKKKIQVCFLLSYTYLFDKITASVLSNKYWFISTK